MMVLGSILTAGCSTPTCWAGGNCNDGESCQEDANCLSGRCTNGVCEGFCGSAADCPEGTFCVAVTIGVRQRQQCGIACEDIVDAYGDHPGIVCAGGVAMRCEDLTDAGSYCDACGCPSGQNCTGGGYGCYGSCECRAAQPFGSSCEMKEDCESLNCSGTSESTTRTCQAAAGTPCTPGGSECVWCEQIGAGSYQCMQSCEHDSDCAGGYCLGSRDRHEFTCRDNCEYDRVCWVGFSCRYLPDINFGSGGYACLPN